jgi:genome maintenance exonuclease 1
MRIKLPELQKVTLETGTRYYVTPEGQKYPSVTTVLSEEKKKALKRWRERVGEEEADRIKNFAAKRGTTFHTLCEEFLDNKVPLDTIGGMFDQFKYLLTRISDIRCMEQHLYSDKLRVAGQVDCIGKFDNILSIIDFKTSSKIKKREYIWDYFMQASAYSYMFEERTGIAISDITVLISCETGECQVFQDKRENWIEGFKKLRELYDIKNIVADEKKVTYNRNIVSDRITNKWTETTVEAFGNKPNVRKGLKAEEIVYGYLNKVYSKVTWFHDKRDKQIQGIDFEFKKDSWRNSYTADVKGNMSNKEFYVYPDEIRNKANHRMIHVDVNSGYAVEYDRKSMLDYLDENPEYIKADKNNNRYAKFEAFNRLLMRRVNHYRPFRIKLA